MDTVTVQQTHRSLTLLFISGRMHGEVLHVDVPLTILQQSHLTGESKGGSVPH